MTIKGKNWLFTLNNPQDVPEFGNGVSYAIYQWEQAPTTGTIHIQGFVHLKMATTRGGVRKFVPAGSRIDFVNSPLDAIEYCSKEDSRISGPTEYGKRPNFNHEGRANSANVCILELARSMPRTEFFTYCVAHRIPKGYYDEAIRLVCTGSIDVTEVESAWDTRIQHGMLKLLTVPQEPCSIVLLGPSGCGKTSWAKLHAPKPSLFVSHADDLKRLRRDHQSIIFDDMDFKHWPRTAQIHIVDQENPRSINIRYGTAQIPAGITKIFTCNEEPFIDDPAIKRRVKTINLFT